MNPKINKIIDEIARTKARIVELQALLPKLERKRIDMENTEIIKTVRNANITPADLPEFIASLNPVNSAIIQEKPTNKGDYLCDAQH